MSDLIKQQKMTVKILWGAFFFTNCVFCGLVFMKVLDGATPQPDLLPYFAGAAILVLFLSLFLFSKATNKHSLSERLLKFDLSEPESQVPDENKTKLFLALSDSDKRQYKFNLDLQTKVDTLKKRERHHIKSYLF